MPKDKNKQGIDLSKYKDLDGLSLKEMNFGLWLSENKKRLTKIVIIFLIALSAFFFVYSSYNYVIYFLNSSTEENNTASLVNSNIVSQRNVASDIIVSVPQIFKNGETYDLVARVTNPNDKFITHFNYCFIVDKVDAGCNRGFILPGEEKYLSSLGQRIGSSSPVVSLNIKDVSWQRVDSHAIPDWKTFVGERINFNLRDIKFTPTGYDAATGKNGLSSLEFTITNLTNYGYYEVPLNIAFYQGSELVGANIYIVKNFLAGEEKAIRLSWFSNISRTARIEIRPNLDLSDESIYLKYQGVQ